MTHRHQHVNVDTGFIYTQHHNITEKHIQKLPKSCIKIDEGKHYINSVSQVVVFWKVVEGQRKGQWKEEKLK